MKKTLLSLAFLLGFGLNTSFYLQSSQDEIPEAVKKIAAEYLKRVPYCPGDPIIKKVGEKLEDRTGPQDVKDGIIDKTTLYEIKNDCYWMNVPTHVPYTQIGLKEGGFAEKGIVIDEIISRDEKGKPIPLKEW